MIKIMKGLDLFIVGMLLQQIFFVLVVKCVVLFGEEYVGMCFVMVVKEGDWVKKGQILFEDKKISGVCFIVLVSGIVSVIYCGEWCVLQLVVIDIEGNDVVVFICYVVDVLVELLCDIVQQQLLVLG